MTVFLIALGIQLLVPLAALVFERGQDPRFEGDKLSCRSELMRRPPPGT
jgi:hypothetical protein